MRIVGGRLKGRVLKGPATQAIRPTSDRLRETIFNMLRHAYGDPVEGARVIDVFAGAGAMALEALSRGARFALLIDQSAEANALIRHNINALGLADSTKILRLDARKLGGVEPDAPFSLAFVDPPYGKGLAGPALVALRDGGWLEPAALVVAEVSEDDDMALPEGFVLSETRSYGGTRIVFARRLPVTSPE